jgi:hypothetical protein
MEARICGRCGDHHVGASSPHARVNRLESPGSALAGSGHRLTGDTVSKFRPKLELVFYTDVPRLDTTTLTNLGGQVAGKARVHELAKELNTTSKAVLQLLAELGDYANSAASIVEAPVADQIRRRRGHAATPAGWQQSRRRQYPRNNPYQDLGRPEIDHRQAVDGPVRPPAAHRPNAFATPRPRRSISEIPPPPLPPLLARPRRPRREWWRGAAPSAFTEYILHALILPRRDEDAPVAKPPWRYFEDEVKEAQEIASKWSACMLAGMDYDEILEWRETLDRFSSRAWLLPPRDGSPDDAIALRAAGIEPTDLRWRYGDETAGTLPERLARGQMTIDEVILEAKYRRGDAV